MVRGTTIRDGVATDYPDARLREPGSIPRIVTLALAVAIATPAVAADRPAATARRVHIGVYVKQIHGISLKDSLATVNFYVWFRWTGDGLKPLESFDLVNGRIESKGSTYEADIGDVHYASCRVVATLNKLWDVARYPLDSHVITIEIEDNNLEADKLIYVPDVENSGLSTHAAVAGWSLKPGAVFVITNTDCTNYGDISLPTGRESSWSRFSFSIEVSRPGFGVFTKLFAGLFIATAIALQSLRVPPDHIDARLGLSVGAMFAAVASEYLVAAGLPESNGVTLAEALHILSFAFIFVALAESIIVYKLASRGREAAADRMDRVCFRAFALVYVALACLIAVR